MSIDILKRKTKAARPIWRVTAAAAAKGLDGLPETAVRWAAATGFAGNPGDVLPVPDASGSLAGAVMVTGATDDPATALRAGGAASRLPAGDWYFEEGPGDADLILCGLLLGAYRFTDYKAPEQPHTLRILGPQGTDMSAVQRTAAAVRLTRDLINTPASDMSPSTLEKVVAALAKDHKARVKVTRGDALLKAGFPMIHAVGRASADAPRLIDMRWGRKGAPKVTLVGKGVCFDTGGLDIKPASGMLLMKKDMGGAANVIGLASMIMTRRLDVDLRLLVPAVENAISGNAFRPGDILSSRKGLTVEIGNTDAEGRLVLADALALAAEDDPDLIIDMATLTGAARVAVGPDLAPYYTDSDAMAGALEACAKRIADPLWRMPLYAPYASGLKSTVADTNNITSGGFAGSITAALFLAKFVEDTARWMHFDIYGWNPAKKPHAPVGGEAHAIRALDMFLAERYG